MKSHLSGAIALENERSLQRLIRAIALSQGNFALILVRCNYIQLRDQMLKNLRHNTPNLEIQEIFLSPTVTTLHTTIASTLSGNPASVMIFGLESVHAQDDVIAGINKARDIYAASFPFPLVLWLSDEVVTAFSRLAPDFKSWGATTIKFEMATTDLITLIRHETDCLFTKVIESGSQRFLSNASIYLDPKSQQRHEIETARNDLHRLHGVKIEADLEASLEFVLGRDAYANDQIDLALSHYQRARAFWHSTEERESGGVSDWGSVRLEDANSVLPLCPPPSPLSPTSVERQGVVLFNIGLCYRRKADLGNTQAKHYWQDALLCFQQSLEVFETATRPDLVAKFMIPVLEMLQRCGEWESLRELALKALLLHQTYGSRAQEAQDYGFLAAVGIQRANWLEAYESATTALAISEQATGVSRQDESWYLLLLARTQRQLGEWAEAVNNLEWARVVCELQYEPSLYLEILEELRSLYFNESHQYLEAFKLKQEKIQIEHQYGFRAFIGASQLQVQRYRISPVAKNRTHTVPVVAQEIAVSGRQQDVNRLLTRITRADYKLTVIHGPSGVGKSSILKAGLVPALTEKNLGDRMAKPVVLSVYTDWIRALEGSLSQALEELDLPTEIELTTEAILRKMRLLSDRNLTIALIFDQFEEFFFVSPEPASRTKFYKFLSDCLNIPFVKVILSLREDYLHYLLECERLSQNAGSSAYNLGVINNNILDKDIRYYLGKFSQADAISIIRSLTARSHYEMSDELIHQLVEDLAVENKVHPIELQIVGAQLQTENITTLDEYINYGSSEKLIERWLEQVIQDCGPENQESSWTILFELTDEKGTRPLRTEADLATAIGIEIKVSKVTQAWELILEILVGSGLVMRVREESGDRYQLVHDYLVEPIRRRNNYGMVAELEKVRFEKTKAEAAQKLSQAQLNLILKRRLREARLAGIVLSMLSLTIGGLWWQADFEKRAAEHQTIRAEHSETNFQITALTAASEALYASNKELDALLESLRAWGKLTRGDIQPDTKMRVVTALQQAVYGVTETNRLEGHRDIVWGVAFSPDGRTLASGSHDKTVKVWNRNGTIIQTLNAHDDSVTSVAFSPDGELIASSSKDKTVKIWRKIPNTDKFATVADKTLLGHEDAVYSVNFSPDGRLLATASKDKTVKLWDRDGKLLRTFALHEGQVNWVSFSPDGELIASASDDGTVKVWQLNGNLVTTLLGHQDGVNCVVFSPNSQLLATAGQDKIIKLWKRDQPHSSDNLNFSLVKNIEAHNGIIWSLNFSHDGQQLVSASADNTLKLWSRTGNLLKTYTGHSDSITSVSFSPDDKLLASASYDKTVKLWSLNPPTLPILRGHTDRVLSVAWSPDGQMLASGSRDNTVKLWARDGTLLKTLTGHTARVTSVSFHPNGQTLASASYDKTVKIWRRDGTLLKTLIGHDDSVLSVSFSPDGKLLASASKDKTVKLWDSQGLPLKTLVGHQGWVNSISFSPDSQALASASDDQTVKIWQSDGTLLKTFSPHDGWVLGVTFSPTDHKLASASWDNTVKLWRQDGTLLKTLLKGYSDSVNAVTFSPDGETLAAASWDSTVRLWSNEGKLIKTLNGHHSAVFSVSFSPDGQALASASDDNTIIIWNLNFDDLLQQGCGWVSDYLQHNPKLDDQDRHLCDGVSPALRASTTP